MSKRKNLSRGKLVMQLRPLVRRAYRLVEDIDDLRDLLYEERPGNSTLQRRVECALEDATAAGSTLQRLWWRLATPQQRAQVAERVYGDHAI